MIIQLRIKDAGVCLSLAEFRVVHESFAAPPPLLLKTASQPTPPSFDGNHLSVIGIAVCCIFHCACDVVKHVMLMFSSPLCFVQTC